MPKNRTRSTPARPRDGVTRRALLKTTVGAAALTVTSAVTSGQEAPPLDTTQRWGRLPNALGRRSPAEQPKRTPSPTSSRTPLQDLHGTITPSDLHYERHHGGVAVGDPKGYCLPGAGMAAAPV